MNSMMTSKQLGEHLQIQTHSNIPQNKLWKDTVTLYVGGELNWMERDTQLCTCALGCNIQTYYLFTSGLERYHVDQFNSNMRLNFSFESIYTKGETL